MAGSFPSARATPQLSEPRTPRISLPRLPAPFASAWFLPCSVAMLFARASLTITRNGETDPVVLVPSPDGLRLRVERGFRLVGRTEALDRFDQTASRNRTRVREFVAEARLGRQDLRELDDHRLRALVCDGIRDGRLVGMRAAAVAEAVASETTRRRRLVRDIEGRGRLDHEGRRYRLVVDVDLASVRDRDSYEVVGRDLARQVLGALAMAPGCAADLIALLAQARDQLAADWRPPVSAPDGLILLRRLQVVPVAAASREPAITPSQLVALVAAGWIEIEFVDGLGLPVEVDCRLELPDSTRVETEGDAEGLVARHGFLPGICRLRLPSLDQARWRLEA